MSSAKGKLLRLLGGVALRAATVTKVEDVAEGFRTVHLQGPSGLGYQPGDKVQVLLPSDDVRTYTPIGGADGRVVLLVYLHGATPAVAWARAVRAGDTVRFVGPQRSLSMRGSRFVVVGDETSVAVAAAYGAAGVFAARDHKAVLEAAVVLGVPSPVVVSPDRSDLFRALAMTAISAGAGNAGVAVGVTGEARIVRGARAELWALGATDVKVKAYWAPGKVGLD